MFLAKTSSEYILTKNLPSNLGLFVTSYLYIFNVVPFSILVELRPVGSSVIKLTSASKLSSKLI